MIKTVIIAGFPGVGKSFLYNQYGEDVSDSDSSKFSKDNFPQNYIEHIKSLIGGKKLILVSTHKEVLEALENEGLGYILVYPKRELKEEYIQRYKDRGSPEGFINLLNSKWDEFHNDLENTNPKRRIILNKGEFLKDRLGK